MLEIIERMLDSHKDRQTATEFDRKHIDRTGSEAEQAVYN